MEVIRKLFLIIIFSYLTKTVKPDIKIKFNALVCENDGCEKKDNNHTLLKRTSFQEEKEEFSVKPNEQSEKKSIFYTDHLTSDINSENINKIVKGVVKFTSPIAEIAELDAKLNNSRDDYLDTGKSNVENSLIFSSNPAIQFKSEKSSELNGSHTLSENASSNSFHPDDSIEITTQIPSPSKLNSTNTQSNLTNLFTVKKEFLKNNTAVCTCNLKVDECDINCCCDEDCSLTMKQIFSYCADLKDMSHTGTGNHCLNFKSIFKTNIKDAGINHGDGLFCIVKNNLKLNLPFTGGQIIQNVTSFQKRITGKKLFKYSSVHAEEPKVTNSSYQIGDYLWVVVNNGLAPFGLPQYHVNKKCNHVQKIRFLTEYSTECLYSVPCNSNSCEKASQLEMNFFLKGGKIIKSPSFINNQNSSNAAEVCNNGTCAEITAHICPVNSNISSCARASPRHLIWDKGSCKNVVSSVEYHFFHNGTEGIKEVRAYFTLANTSSNRDSYFMQSIKLKYFWAKVPAPAFIRSGNPGYIIGKPIMAGKKTFSNNETSTQKKEAIDLSINPEDWLSVAGSKKGICTSDKRQALNFGENLVHSCLISLNDYDLTKKKCLDLQEVIFKFLIGNEYVDIKSNNRFNKYVATFGNSRVEETGDWARIIIDTLPIVSSQPILTVFNEIIVCKNMVTELFINVAYSKIGSFKNPQNKILGVQFYFGSSKNIIYTREYKYTGFKSSETVKISTFVKFIDFSTKPEAEFAETPGFEAKFPHDFFYPFFSGCSHMIGENTFIIFSVALLRFSL